MFRLSVIAALLLSLTACATHPSYEERQAADYGAPIESEACLAIAEETIRKMLKDPESANFDHTHCIKGYWSSVPLMNLPVAYGYLASGFVNAKNSFGGYTGFSEYNVLIRNGRVVRRCIAQDGVCVPN